MGSVTTLLVLTPPVSDNTMLEDKSNNRGRLSQLDHAPPPPDSEYQGSEAGDGSEDLADATEPASNAREGTPAPVTQPSSNANAPNTPAAGHARNNDQLKSTPINKGTSANATTMQSTKCVVSDVRAEQHPLMIVLKA
jgi:hypothetical protein